MSPQLRLIPTTMLVLLAATTTYPAHAQTTTNLGLQNYYWTPETACGSSSSEQTDRNSFTNKSCQFSDSCCAMDYGHSVQESCFPKDYLNSPCSGSSGAGNCGNGTVGNGMCPDSSDCCTPQGECVSCPDSGIANPYSSFADVYIEPSDVGGPNRIAMEFIATYPFSWAYNVQNGDGTAFVDLGPVSYTTSTTSTKYITKFVLDVDKAKVTSAGMFTPDETTQWEFLFSLLWLTNKDGDVTQKFYVEVDPTLGNILSVGTKPQTPPPTDAPSGATIRRRSLLWAAVLLLSATAIPLPF